MLRTAPSPRKTRGQPRFAPESDESGEEDIEDETYDEIVDVFQPHKHHERQPQRPKQEVKRTLLYVCTEL